MASALRPAVELLAQYAEYHRDRRNIATHLVGVPTIVFGVLVLLAGARLALGGLVVTAADAAFVALALWMLTRGELALALVTTAVVGALTLVADRVAQGSFATWLAWGLGAFVAGWIVQFIGHWYEGRKPAFVDDVVGLIVAPMFVVLEAGAPFGGFARLNAEVERRAGPTHVRDMAHPAAH